MLTRTVGLLNILFISYDDFENVSQKKINKVSFVSDVVSNDGSLADALSDAEPNVNFGEDQSVLGGFSSGH